MNLDLATVGGSLLVVSQFTLYADTSSRRPGFTGAAKPDPAYFDYVFARIGGITKENCIVIGDSLSSDIRGANNYGLPCCWYDPKNSPAPADLRIDYRITDLRQLYQIV